MNRNRIIGGTLIGIALLWILRIAGALPFSDRSTNQLNQNQATAQTPPNRPLVTDFDATRTSIANFNPGTGTQTLNPPGTGAASSTDPNAIAQTPGSETPSGTTAGGGTTSGTTPAIRAAW